MSRADEDEDTDIAPPPPPADWAAQLLHFWFDAHGYQDWFRGGDAFDAEVRAHFSAWREALRSFPPEHFLSDADTALAGVILFDQVPRNVHRGSAEAFATDTLALAIARGAVTRGFDVPFDTHRRMFLYLPFEHSETLADQDRSVELFASIGNAELDKYAKLHRDLIVRFGRFPHRNAALGRESTQEEIDYLASGGFSG